jgi:hypothetical protein
MSIVKAKTLMNPIGRPIGGELITTPESLEVGFFPVEKAL